MAIEFYKIHTMHRVLTYVCKAPFNMSFDKKKKKKGFKLYKRMWEVVWIKQ